MARRLAAGFTLVEVLVALLVMAVMASMAWQGVDGIVRARDASQAHLDRTLRLDAVIGQWQADLAAVQDSFAVPAFGFDGATLRLTRRSGEGLQVVAWSLKPGLDGGADGASWLRWAGPVATSRKLLTESWFNSLQLLGNEPGQMRTLSGLSQWQVYCFRESAWTNCQSSGDVAAPAPGGSASTVAPAREALPEGVRLVLGFAPGGPVIGELTRDTLVGQ